MGLFDFFSDKSKTHRDNNGYNRFNDSNTPVHRWAAEKKLGRKLTDEEVVHHKDRNKLNNSPENLHVFSSQAAHWKAHKKDASQHGWSFSLKGKKKK